MTDALRIGALAGMGVLVATSGFASPYSATWSAFEQRCLAPFEAYAPAVTEDLVQSEAGRWALPGGAVLTLSGADADGARACVVTGAGLVKGFEAWRAEAEASGRYVRPGPEPRWLSHEWLEPVIMIEKLDGAVRVVETDLES